MSTRLIGSLAVCAPLIVALSTAGCLGGDDTAAIPGPDSGIPDTSVVTPTIDSSIPPDSAAPPVVDAAPDAEDATPPPLDAGPLDAGTPIPSQVGLVGGGTVSRSTHYSLVGSTGPATAPVLHSTNYQLVGGMTASTQKR